MPNIVKLRRGTATQWAANNPVLASGEVGVELSVSGSPQALKIGNGTSTWNALPYFVKAGGVPQPIAYGDAGAAGTSVEFARSDHKHAVSGFATPDDVNQLELRKESRGTNLVTNGGLMMGNNYNFPQLTYSGLESPIGYNGSLYTSVWIDAVSTEKIAINLAKKIRISAWIKWTHNGLSIPPNIREYHYLGVNFYDIDGNSIQCKHCGYREGSTTFLTADLEAGQSVMQVDSVTGWDDTVNASYRMVQIWNYANSYGYVYPEEVYTRNHKRFTSISGTTITLSSPHTGATIPAGTKVSQQHYGSNDWVMLGAPFISQVNEEWEYTEAFLTKSGKLSSTTDRTGLMPLATAYVKLRLGLNYMKFPGGANANLDSRTYISGIRVDEMPVDSNQRIANPGADYTIDPVLDKLILVDCSNNDVMITMPVIAQSMGREFIIRHHKGANMVKIKGQPNNTVDGQTTITLTTVKDFVRLINDGNSDWCLVGGAYS